MNSIKLNNLGRLFVKLRQNSINHGKGNFRLRRDKNIIIDADNDNEIQLGKEGLSFNYNKSINLPNGTTAKAKVKRSLKGAAFTKKELFNYNHNSSNPASRVDKRHVIVTAKALTDLLSTKKDGEVKNIKKVSNTLDNDKNNSADEILPTVEAVKSDLGITFDDIKNLSFNIHIDETNITLTWKENENDLFNKLKFSLFNKSTFSNSGSVILDSTNQVAKLVKETNNTYLLMVELFKDSESILKVNKIIQ